MNALSFSPGNGLSIGVGEQGRASDLRNRQAGEDLLDRVLMCTSVHALISHLG